LEITVKDKEVIAHADKCFKAGLISYKEYNDLLKETSFTLKEGDSAYIY